MMRYITIPMALLIFASAWCGGPTPAWAQNSLDDAFGAAAKYEFGQSRECLSVITDAVRDSQNSPEQRNALREKLTAMLKSDATLDAKDFACRMLAAIGNDDSVPVLADMIGEDQRMADMGRYALERIPGKVADKALIAALGSTKGVVKIGVINSLGARRCEDAANSLAGLITSEDADMAQAAMAALGKIANATAVDALAGAKGKVPAPLHAVWADSYLLCADKLVAEGKNDAALKIYEELATDELERVKVAAFMGRTLALGDKAVPLVVEALTGSSAQLQGAAAVRVRSIKASGATQAFADALGKLQAPGQILLLSALGDRGDKAAFPSVAALLKSGDADVRIAALNASGKIGDASCIMDVAKVAATTSKDEQDAARNCLDVLKGEDVDGAMVAAMKSADAAMKIELARSLGARNAKSAVPALLEAAKDADENVRAESFKSLGALATANELPAITDLLLSVEGEKARKEAERAVAQVAKTLPQEDQRAAVVIAALGKAKSPDAEASLYTVIGDIGDPNGVKPLQDAIKSGKEKAREAAVRALSSWPNVQGLDPVTELAENAKDDTFRVLAIRGMIRLLEMPSDRPVDASMKYYERALKASKKADEAKLVLGALGKGKNPAALSLIDPYLENEETKNEAALASNAIKVTAYTAKASVAEGDAKNAFDGNKDSRWASGAPQKGGEWFQLDLGREYKVSKVVLDVAGSQDFPRGYQVFVSSDEQNWGDPVAQGSGTAPLTEIAFNAKNGKFVKIVQTGSDPQCWWGINEMTVETRMVK